MDLDFGVKKWYAKPTFLLKILFILLTIIISIYLFHVCSLLANPYFKTIISRGPILFGCFLAIFILISLTSFIVLIFRLFAALETNIQTISTIVLFINIGFSAFYFIFSLIFVFTFCTNSCCTTYTKRLTNYIDTHINDSYVFKFLQSIDSSYLSRGSDDEQINAFVSYRTIGLSVPLFGLSIIWVILLIIIYYSLLYNGQLSRILFDEPKNLEALQRDRSKNNLSTITVDNDEMELKLTDSPQIHV